MTDSVKNNSLKSSYIKKVCIELSDYKLYHEPYTDSHEKDWMIGRESIEEELSNVLLNDDSRSGAYLVTGYRGVGKTSLVRRAIARAKQAADSRDRQKPISVIEISLAQDDLSEDDILRMIARQMAKRFEELGRFNNVHEVGFSKRIKWYNWSLGDLWESLESKRNWRATAITFIVFLVVFSLSCYLDVLGNILGNTPQFIYKFLPDFMRGENPFLKVLVYVLFSVAITNLLIRGWYALRSYLGYPTSKSIRNKLQRLSERLDSSVRTNSEGGIGESSLFKGIKFNRVKERVFPVANSKDIQNELRDIIQEISKLEFAIMPRFILVFDELDKASPQYNYGVMKADLQIREESNSAFKASDGPSEKVRQHQETIAKILGGLKYFFNNAGAKFIFIAGREMYDSALADTSDRDAFVGSIFDDVFYVPSFMRNEDNKQKYEPITGLTEHFLCRHIVKSNENEKPVTLKNVAKALQEKFEFDEIVIVLSLLEDFILYLNYRSNGTPKKIAHLLEDFIHPIQFDEQDSNVIKIAFSDDSGRKTETSNSYYLRFSYHDQFRISLVARLFRPFLIANAAQHKHYSDKILVSTTFLLDHITKFHHAAFSWQALEYTPELISALKTPDIRTLLIGIIENLEQYSLRRTISGIFQYKFRPKYRFDIIYSTKTHEQESAGLSFTLDESFVVKRHFSTLLQVIQANSSRGRIESHQKSMAVIYEVLGDLHYYDQEYHHAIVNYKESRELHNKGGGKLGRWMSLVSYVNCQLKIGLSYERMRDFQRAYVLYSDACLAIVEFVKKEVEKKSNRKKILWEYGKGVQQNIELFQEALIARLQLMEKTSATGASYADILDSSATYHRLANSFLNGVETEDVLNRARYHLRVGLFLYFKNGHALIDKAGSGQKHILGFIEGIERELKSENNVCQYPSSAVYEYLLGLGLLLVRISYTLNLTANGISGEFIVELRKLLHETRAKDSCTLRLAKLLSQMVEKVGFGGTLGVIHNLFSLSVIEYQRNSSNLNWGSDFEETAGELLTRIGDAELSRLSCGNPFPIQKEKFLGLLDPKDLSVNPKGVSVFERAFRFYHLAARFFALCKSPRLEAFTYNKMIHLIHEQLEISVKKNKKAYKEVAGEIGELVDKILIDVNNCQLASTNYFGLARRNRFVELFGENHKQGIESLNRLDFLSVTDFKREGVIFRIKILRLLKKNSSENDLKNPIYYLNLPKTLSSMFERVQDLMLYVQIGYDKFNEHFCSSKALLTKELREHFPNNIEQLRCSQFVKSIANLIDDTHLIVDCIGALVEVVRILKIFGEGYIIRNSYLGLAYEWLGDWSVVYHYYSKLQGESNGNNDLTKVLKDRISSFASDCENPKYFYGRCLSCYKRAIDIHQSGVEYRDSISGMNYLEDDFGDQLSHFSIATERGRINYGSLERKCKEIEAILSRETN